MSSFDNVITSGLENVKLADLLSQKWEGVVCALNNADTDYLLLSILEDHTAEVFAGIDEVAKTLGVNEKVLVLPEAKADVAGKVAAEASKHGVTLESGIVNVRKFSEYLMLHIATAYDVALATAGKYEDGVYVAVDGTVKKVSGTTKVSDLVNVSEAKAFVAGYKVYPASFAGKTVVELKVPNGVLRALSDRECVVSYADKQLMASRKQSCGKCVFCREGLIQLEHMQREIAAGRGKAEYLDMTREIGEAMCFSTPCSMGQNSALVALSAVEGFDETYQEHFRKVCDVCFSTEVYYVEPMACTGCTKCMSVCPQDAIDGAKDYIHLIDSVDCDRCGKCMEVCEANCIKVSKGRTPKLPNRPYKLGRYRA